MPKKNPGTCIVEGCGKKQFGRDWCSTHYQRWITYGDPTQGRTLNGEAKAFFWSNVVSFKADQCLIWPFTRNTRGYGTWHEKGKSALVHRVACEEVYGQPPTSNHHAAHSCGKGRDGCVNPMHVRWATPAENNFDRTLHGTQVRGESCSYAKLTANDVIKIRSTDSSTAKAAKEFGVSQSQISAIRLRKAWAHI